MWKALGGFVILAVVALIATGQIRTNWSIADAAPGDRNICSQITGTAYYSEDERNWYWQVCNGKAAPPVVSSTTSQGNTAASSCTGLPNNGYLNPGPAVVRVNCIIYGWYEVTVNGRTVLMYDDKGPGNKTTVAAKCTDANGCPVNVKYGGTRIVANPVNAVCDRATDCTYVAYADSLIAEATRRAGGSTTSNAPANTGAEPPRATGPNAPCTNGWMTFCFDRGPTPYSDTGPGPRSWGDSPTIIFSPNCHPQANCSVAAAIPGQPTGGDCNPNGIIKGPYRVIPGTNGKEWELMGNSLVTGDYRFTVLTEYPYNDGPGLPPGMEINAGWARVICERFHGDRPFTNKR